MAVHWRNQPGVAFHSMRRQVAVCTWCLAILYFFIPMLVVTLLYTRLDIYHRAFPFSLWFESHSFITYISILVYMVIIIICVTGLALPFTGTRWGDVLPPVMVRIVKLRGQLYLLGKKSKSNAGPTCRVKELWSTCLVGSSPGRVTIYSSCFSCCCVFFLLLLVSLPLPAPHVCPRHSLFQLD